jgi:hypothetical protein
MDDLEAIAATLRRQREDLEDLLDGSLSRGAETSILIDKITELRRRAEETQRLFEATMAGERRPDSRL